MGSVLVQNDSQLEGNSIYNTRAVTENLFEIKDQALIESMSRSILTKVGDWTPSNSAITTTLTDKQLDGGYTQPTLFEINLPGDLFNKSSMLKGKFANIAYFNADCEVNLRLQGTPFMQGMLYMAQVPYTKGTSQSRATYNEHLRSLSTFPGVTVNLQNPSRSVTLTVPYVNEFQAINPSDDDGLTSIRCWVIVPLDSDTASSASLKATWSVTAQLKNIRLFGNAPTLVTRKEHVIKKPLRMVNTTCTQREAHVHESSFLACQDSLGEDEQASSRGIVSTVATKVGDVADIVADIPGISRIAKPIGWVARAVSNVASFFGFSKTIDLEKTSVYANVPARGYTNGVGIDQSVTLGVLPDNSIDPTKATFANEDEMAVSYIAQKPYILGAYDWVKDLKEGDVVCEIPVHPSNFSTYGATVRGMKGLFTAPVGLVSRLAQWWRGQICVNFEFAKTQFHQGRLLVQYLPYGRGAQGLETVYSYILDISQIEHTGYMVNFPMVAQNKWLSTADNAPNAYTDGASAGVVVVSVLNPLVGTPTVAEQVTVIPRIHWEDFQIAEQTSTAKVALSNTYSPDVGGAGLVINTTNGKLEFTTLVSQTIYFSGDLYARSASFGYTIDIRSSSGTFKKTIAGVTDRGAERYVGFGPLTIPAGTFIVESSNKDKASNFNIVTSKAAKVISGSITHEVEVASYGPLVDGESILLNSPTLLCVGGYKIPIGRTSARWVISPRDQVVSEYNATSETFENRFVSLDGTGAFSVKDQEDGSTWLRLDVRPTLRCEDFQKGDESTLDTTMGEVIPSLRLLTRRFTLSQTGNSYATTLQNCSIGTPSSLRQSLFDVISFMYRFTSGSIRHKVVTGSKRLLAVIMANPNNTIPESSTPLDINTATHIQDTNLNPIVEVSVPFYSPAENLAVGSQTFDLSGVAVGSLDGQNFDFNVLTAAGDDHTFSFMVGCPAFVV